MGAWVSGRRIHSTFQSLPGKNRCPVKGKECTNEVKAGAEGGEEGMAPMYGMAERLPDRNIVGDVLVAYQEATLDC